MEFFKWIAMIVFIVMAAEVIKYYIRSKQTSSKSEKQREEDQARIEALEERVRTLEKIVTDPSENLRREIDGLNH